MATFTATVKLRNRASGVESGPVTVNYGVGEIVQPPPDPDPVTTPLIGSSVPQNTGETWAQALVRHDAETGPHDIFRVFYTSLPDASWAGSKADQCNRPVVVSFKANPADVNAGKHDALLRGWFASMPTNEHKIWWSFYHEPEDNIARGEFTAAAFRSAFRRVAGLAAEANNPNLFSTLILMGWTVDPASGRNFTNYWPGGDVVDVIGWDPYSALGKYETPAAVFDAAAAKSQEMGKPWGIAETGAMQISSDATGSGQANWINSVRTYMGTKNPVWVIYWNSTVTKDGVPHDYRLKTSAAKTAWSNWAKAV